MIATRLDREVPIALFSNGSAPGSWDETKRCSSDALRAKEHLLSLHDGKQRPNASSNLGDP